MTSRMLLAVLAGAAVACGGGESSDVGGIGNPDGGTGADADMDAGARPDAAAAPDARPRADGAITFTLRVENPSAQDVLPSALSAGLWAVHTGASPFFTSGSPDPRRGLEDLAEDGDPEPLARRLLRAPIATGTISALAPGEAREVTFTIRTASAANARLSLITKVMETNDAFVTTTTTGVALLDARGEPIAEQEVPLELFESGTEADQAPGLGGDQAPRQPAPDTGAAEGVVRKATDPTRALPLALGMAEVTVAGEAGGLRFTVKNVSVDRGPLTTALSAAFYALHDERFSLFTLGQPASAELELLAENGAPEMLASRSSGAAGVASAMVAGRKLSPGESYAFSVRPTAAAPLLSLALHVDESNDALIALRPGAVRLVDAQGMPRAAADVQRDLDRALLVLDAGTERNEVPGAGANQTPRQTAQGPADTDRAVRLHDDRARDLEGPRAGGLASVTVAAAAQGQLTVTFSNTSGATAFPARFSTLVWVLHRDGVVLFREGAAASMALRALADDANGGPLKSSLRGMNDTEVDVVETPQGAPAPGPVGPGQSYRFTVAPTAARPVLSLVAKLVGSEDTFVALEGVRLVDAQGGLRPTATINAELTAGLAAWDAGTEGTRRVRPYDGRWPLPPARSFARGILRLD